MSVLLPPSQRAVQLVGSDALALNGDKPVVPPGPHQILAEVQAVGLCYSDLKLLKQFSQHVRKSEVTGGISAEALAEMPNYVPGGKPAVPGHEAVVRVVAVGPGVSHHQVGERLLVQTDYRWLPTARSNAAFGYNFEGALQEYVLMDERVITSPEGESMLIPVPEEFAASAIALIEPWACVENAYAEKQRRSLKPQGRAVVVADNDRLMETARLELPGLSPPTFVAADRVADLAANTFDDILYFGSDPATIETLVTRLAPGGLLGILQCGGRFGRAVRLPVGRVHYGGIRIAGTTTSSVRALIAAIPQTADLPAKAKVNVVGAAGPMGTMHVVRALCREPGVTVYAGDLNDERLAGLEKLAKPLAAANGCAIETYNPSRGTPAVAFDYVVVMAPVPALVQAAVKQAGRGGIINIFAGIPAEVTAEIDLDATIAKSLYFIGTSGSVLADMKRVLAEVVARRLDTNLSVAAVAGLDGAIAGIRAVEKNAVPGKIVVYPSCRGLPLTPLAELKDVPVDGNLWTKASEDALLQQWKRT